MMRIVCPACAAAYEVPDDRFTTGRRIRCVNCGETWLAAVVRPASGAEEKLAPPDQLTPSAPPIAPVRRTVVEPLDPQRYDRLVNATPVVPAATRSPVWIGWAATVVILAAVVWGGYTYRLAVMTAWPPSTRVYAALGLIQ